MVIVHTPKSGFRSIPISHSDSSAHDEIASVVEVLRAYVVSAVIILIVVLNCIAFIPDMPTLPQEQNASIIGSKKQILQTNQTLDSINCPPTTAVSTVKSETLPQPLSQAEIDELVYKRQAHFDSNNYWEKRYKSGGNSGAGSYGETRQFKADHLNTYVKDNNIQTVLEFGFGDGSQLEISQYPKYVGLDVSKTILKATSQKFASDPTKQFFHTSNPIVPFLQADMVMSLDVLFHLIDQDLYINYVKNLFLHSKKHVAIYACNKNNDHAEHVLFRAFTPFIEALFPSSSLVFNETYPESDNGCSGIYFFQKD